jgi:hypothetical protein
MVNSQLFAPGEEVTAAALGRSGLLRVDERAIVSPHALFVPGDALGVGRPVWIGPGCRVGGHTAWLRALVWADHPQRAILLSHALTVARSRPPIPLHTGDGAEQLPALIASAPADMTVCLFHTAFLGPPAQARPGALRAPRRGSVSSPAHLLGTGRTPPRPRTVTAAADALRRRPCRPPVAARALPPPRRMAGMGNQRGTRPSMT